MTNARGDRGETGIQKELDGCLIPDNIRFRETWIQPPIPDWLRAKLSPPLADSLPFHHTLALVDRAQRDDSAALQELFTRYLPRVRRIVALRVGRNQQEILDLDDVTQEALIDALRGLAKFSAQSDASFVNWLSKLVVNRIRMAWRAAATEGRGGGRVQRFADADHTVRDSHLIGDTPTPSKHAEATEVEDQMAAKIQLLPERYREVIIERAQCQMSYEEIAQSMDFPNANAARAFFSKALRRLNALMPSDESQD